MFGPIVEEVLPTPIPTPPTRETGDSPRETGRATPQSRLKWDKVEYDGIHGTDWRKHQHRGGLDLGMSTRGNKNMEK